MIGYKFVDDPRWIESGSIRFRTPAGFAKLEGIRRDPYDSAVITEHQGDWHLENGIGRSITVGQYRFDDCGEIHIGNVSGPVVTRHSAPMLIFCTSWNVANELARHDATAVFEVDLDLLERAFISTFGEQIAVVRCSNVVYGQISHPPDAAPMVADPFLKDERFRGEEELRLAFAFKSGLEARPDQWPDGVFDLELGPQPAIFKRLPHPTSIHS